MRKTKKTLALLLTLAMVLTLFAGVAQASTDVRITSSAAVVRTGGDRALGTIVVSNQDSFAVWKDTATVVTVTLPSGVTWNSEQFDGDAIRDIGINYWDLLGGTPSGVTSTLERVDAQVAKFRVEATTHDVANFQISLIADIASGFSGNVNATVSVQSEDHDGRIIFWEQTETERIAVVAAGGTTSTAISTTNVSRGIGHQLVGDIRIRENIADVLTEGGRITLSLPSGVTFSEIGAGAVILAGNSTAQTVVVPTSSAVTTMNITGIRLNIGPGVSDGPIIVTISGAEATAATVTVATVGAVGAVSVSARNVPADPVTAGQLGVEVADIRFTENLDGALLGRRTVTLTLPVGFTWNLVTVATTIMEANPSVTDSGRTLTYWTPADPTPSTGSHFDITEARINTRIDAPAGDIVVTAGGTAGVSGTAVLATLRRAATVTAVTVPNVRADARAQTLGNIVVSEAFPGAFMEGSLTVELPSGFTFDGTPSVAISDVVGTEPSIRTAMALNGDRTIATVELNRAVTPTNAASVTISGIRVNATRLHRVLLGAFDVNVGGTALLELAGSAPNDPGISGVTHSSAVGANVATITVANIVAETARTTVFTIDATAYTVDGVNQPALDVAPVIQDGRTMMPIRAAANAAGVTAENILFDAGVITIIRGDRVAQFTLGSRVMVVNGVAMNMDVAPALVAGRALIPVRWVGTALGVPVAWDSAARTVTVTVQ